MQSALFLAEYEPEAVVHETLSAWHSGDPPESFTSRPFFGEYVRNFLAPFHSDWAEEIERRMLIPFCRQWAYEWEVVLRRRPFELSVSSLRYWFGHQKTDSRCVAVDTPLSEVYRSAYLRALAWAVDTRGMNRDLASVRTAETVPVDLELWLLRPGTRPNWWPRAAVSGNALETAPGDIWPAVDKLWQDDQARSAAWGADWVLARADGRVRGGETLYDLSVLACFQRAVGGRNPDAGDVFEWCDQGEETFLLPLSRPRLRFAGTVRPVWAGELATAFGGWSVVPAVGRFTPGASISRWQWWRWYRGMWGPGASLTPDGYTFRRDGDSLAFESGGEVIGRWSDWTEELRELLAPQTLPATGQLLLIRREVIERFTAQHQARFCWLVRLTAFCRQQQYQLYQPVHDHRVYGASRIVLPL